MCRITGKAPLPVTGGESGSGLWLEGFFFSGGRVFWGKVGFNMGFWENATLSGGCLWSGGRYRSIMQQCGRLRLRPWLEEQIQSGRYPGVSWLDQVNLRHLIHAWVQNWYVLLKVSLPVFSKWISQHKSSKSHGNMQLVTVGVLTKMQHCSGAGPCTLVGALHKL